VKIHCATGNPGKLREFQLAGELLDIDIAPLDNLQSIAAPDEHGATFEENARIKAEYYSQFTPGLLFADDSGLEVDALGGEPGVRSARYAGGVGHAVNNRDAANNQLLLERLGDRADRTGRFVCVIALAESRMTIRTFRGEVEGEILRAARGPGGFGYDPLFYYPPFRRSFGEVDDAWKFSVSHRGNALRKMLDYLASTLTAT
jgi:XTP/dITP diphosphohydrolase